MNRIEATFEKLKAEGRKALITFVMGGDPDEERSAAVLDSLPEAGADIIEIGMPFTDPMADGPAIQAAGLRALGKGASLKNIIKMVQHFRSKNTDTPIVLMGYFNPILAYGPENFIQDTAKAGVDGLIIVDLPPEEDMELRPRAEAENLCLTRLVTPTTQNERLDTVINGASGFLYYVSITGVTGTASADIDAVGEHIRQIREHTDLPICVGFGIKTPEDAAAMAKIADGVVVGSAIVQNIEKYQDDSEFPKHIAQQVSALKNAI